MTAPENAPDAAAPNAADVPVFAEPWQAQAFALTVHLHQSGVFTWAEWAQALAAQLAGVEDDGTHYYEHWLAALEGLVAERGCRV